MIDRRSKQLRDDMRCLPVKRRNSGFTLIELLSATVLTAIVLLGVYGVFQQAIMVEQRVSAKWQDRAAARAVVNQLAAAIETLVILPDIPALQAGPIAGDDGYQLLCTVAGETGMISQPRNAAIEYRWYRWGLGEADKGRVLVQTRCMAGTKDITLSPQALSLPPAKQWTLVAPQVIAQDVSSVSVEYRPLDQPDLPWETKWSGPDDKVMVRIRVEVGSQTVQRLVAPNVNAAAVSSGKGSG